PFTKKRDVVHKDGKLPQEFPDERPLSCQIWSVSGRAGALRHPVRRCEPTTPGSSPAPDMASGTTGLFLRHGGFGAVLQTGPASGFRFLCEGGTCAKKLRKNRWRSSRPAAPGTRNMRRVSDS